MKKLLSMILAVAVIMSVLCVSVSAEEATELTAAEKNEILLRNADANGDGFYSTADVTVLLKAAAGTGDDKDSFDVNSDGVTSLEDAIMLLKHTSGIEPLLSNEEAVELFNAKVNAVKNRDKGLPGFEKTITATCNSMKITQDVQASGLASLVAGQMACTDLEYDKYVDKMVGLMSSGNMTAEDKENIEAMKQSAKDYRKPQVEVVEAVAGDYVDHFLDFPRDAMNTASEITTADISSVSYTMSGGNIVFTLKLPNKTYTSLSAFNANPYAKVMNVVEFDEDDGSKVNKIELKNGSVVVKFDAQTGAMKNANYSYNYYSDISAPEQSQTDSDFGTVTVKLKTKTTATVTESVVF